MSMVLKTNCLNPAAVANLTANDIDAMYDAELVQIVKTVSNRFDGLSRAEYMDRQTLTTMAFLARRCCQREVPTYR